MRPAEEFQVVTPRFVIWEAYDARSRVDCTTNAVLTDEGWVVCDPAPLAEEPLQQLRDTARIRAVVCTSCNHERSCADFALRNACPLLAPSEAIAEFGWREALALSAEAPPLPGSIVAPIEGAAPGEIALLLHDGRHAIFGDAVINLHSTGLALLPDKYCSSPKSLRFSLEKLLQFPLETLSFAHGLPILANGRARLEQILA